MVQVQNQIPPGVEIPQNSGLLNDLALPGVSSVSFIQPAIQLHILSPTLFTVFKH